MSEQERVVRMHWEVRIPMRDGVRLSATLYLPSGPSTPSPTIFTLTPYIAQIHHERGVYFAAHGYPFLTVDVRGRGNSEGTFKPNVDALDGHDIVEWIATQPFCSGKVAMWGGSYGGLNQWTTASTNPPHLSTIVPVASPHLGVDFPIRTNIALTYLMRWLTLVSGRAEQDKMFADYAFWNRLFRGWFESGRPFKSLDVFVGNPSATFQEWISHPELGAYWDGYAPTSSQYADLTIPIMTITGGYDGDQPGALMHYRKHLAAVKDRTRHYLVIGPWDHAGTRTPKVEFRGLKAGPASLVDLPKLHLDWYSWTMQEGRKPEFLKKNVAYYVLGADVWRYADTLEEVTASWKSLYLRSSANATDVFASGLLTEQMPISEDPDYYVYDPRETGHAALESTIDPENVTDQRMIIAMTGKQLVYHSASLEADTEVSGFFRFSVWISIDQPDTDFCASVYEIGPEGGSLLLTRDYLRARYRESLHDAKLVESRVPLRYDFERFTFISRLIPKGARLRLVIGPINSIHYERNHNTGGVVADESIADARRVTVRVFHDRDHPSALYVPLGQPDAEAGR
jgi:uncharacterized protein